MKHNIIKAALLTFFLSHVLPLSSSADEYRATNGSGTFSVSAPAKTIYAESENVHIAIDDKTGALFLKVPITSFRFTNNFISDSMNAVIHERFNNYYMESSRYPYVTYRATISNKEAILMDKDGNYPVHATGTLQIHGVDREVSTQGIIHVKGGIISVEAKIEVAPQDYNIGIPDYIGNMYFKEVRIESKAILKKIR